MHPGSTAPRRRPRNRVVAALASILPLTLLAAGGYRAIVSKGPQHELIELRDGQVGAELVPQPALLPMVDAVITHGGNNTVT